MANNNQSSDDRRVDALQSVPAAGFLPTNDVIPLISFGLLEDSSHVAWHRYATPNEPVIVVVSPYGADVEIEEFLVGSYDGSTTEIGPATTSGVHMVRVLMKYLSYTTK